MARARRIRSAGPLVVGAALLAAVTTALGWAAATWLRPAARGRGVGPRPPAAPSAGPQAPASCTRSRPCLAVVIDDVGRALPPLRRLMAIDAPLTFAVLPHARHSARALAELRARGREVIAHLPMQPVNPSAVTDEPVVIGAPGPLSVGGAARECLERVPGARGANNHMGSALSRDPGAAAQLFAELAARSMWFLDSRTAPRSGLCAAARRAKVACVERDVFLDDPVVPGAVDLQLASAVRSARERGWAVAIGHPLPSTVSALERALGRKLGIEVVELSRIVGAVDGS